ncbi:hypothetical protein [Pseudogemmobacter bohemicus]|uniref:hypothetical protein n=1 Tax=Pseudogemmobacter bohemicus TaxID=2250708 RepID=UPI0013009540|nr:hypothetical protein [Pseudogemmobacter bohemicus]
MIAAPVNDMGSQIHAWPDKIISAIRPSVISACEARREALGRQSCVLIGQARKVVPVQGGMGRLTNMP